MLRTIQALPLILGAGRKVDADFLDSCRRKRSIVEYDRIGAVSARSLSIWLSWREETLERGTTVVAGEASGVGVIAEGW